jgi:hypothetical protein
MKSNNASNSRKQPNLRPEKIISPPEAVLAAAQKAPRVFSIVTYFSAIYVMRKKGHSWRALSEWLEQFNIEVSHVHLNRLYAQEDERLSQLSIEDMETAGMPRDMIEDYETKAKADKLLTGSDVEEAEQPESK